MKHNSRLLPFPTWAPRPEPSAVLPAPLLLPARRPVPSAPRPLLSHMQLPHPQSPGHSSQSELSYSGSFELTPALHALLQQHAQHVQQGSGQAAPPGDAAAASAPGGMQHAPSAGAESPAAAGSQMLPLEMHANLQEQESQQRAAAVAAAVAASTQHQHAVLGWALGGGSWEPSMESLHSDATSYSWCQQPDGQAHAYQAAAPPAFQPGTGSYAGLEALQPRCAGWPSQPSVQSLGVPQALPRSGLPQSLFMLQLPQHLQLQALLAQQQALGARRLPPRQPMPQASTAQGLSSLGPTQPLVWLAGCAAQRLGPHQLTSSTPSAFPCAALPRDAPGCPGAARPARVPARHPWPLPALLPAGAWAACARNCGLIRSVPTPSKHSDLPAMPSARRP